MTNSVQSGRPGTPGLGGDGASGMGCGNLHPGGGGGGGGGFQGGGGGGDGENGHTANIFTAMRGGGGGGGGGGSNFIGPAATDVSVTDGVAGGSGTVSISYSSRLDQTISFPLGAPSDAVHGGQVDYVHISVDNNRYTAQFTASGACARTDDVTYRVRYPGAGTCTITATQPGGQFYNAAAPQILTFPVARAMRYMAFPDHPYWQQVGSDYYLSPLAYGAGQRFEEDVVYGTTGGCTNTGAMIHFTGVGLCNVTADLPETENFEPTQQQTIQFWVSKGPQAVVFTSTPPTAPAVGDSYSPTATGSRSGEPIIFGASGSCSVNAGGVVSFTGGGRCVVTADQAGNASYEAAPQQSQTIAVERESQVLKFTSTPPPAPTHGFWYDVTATGGPSGAPVVVGASGACHMAQQAQVRFWGTGNCVVTIDQAGADGHTAAPQQSQTFNVGRSSQTLYLVDNYRYDERPRYGTVGGGDHFFTYGGQSSSPVVLSTSGPCTADGVYVAYTGAGQCTVTASQAGDDNYEPAPPKSFHVITIQPAVQHISFSSDPPSSAMVGETYVPSAVGGATGNPVVFGTSGPCTLSAEGVVTFTGAGECVVTADQDGSADYQQAGQLSRVIAVGQVGQVVSFTSDAPSSAMVGDTYEPVAVGGASGEPVVIGATGPCEVSAQGVVTFTGAGECVVTADQAGSAGFAAAPQQSQTISVGQVSQVVSFTSSPPSAPVVGDTYEPVAVGGASGEPVVIGATGPCEVSAQGVVTFTGAGECVVTADQAGSAGFAAAPQQSQTISVGKALQPVAPGFGSLSPFFASS
ncbi:MAG: hypothetical protein ACK4UY_05315 [Dietzia sp.]